MAKTLLLADDSVVIQKLVGLSFANEDIELVSTDNGDDALARARETRPDLVLADVVMPGKNGYELCEALKADAALHDVPVLLLTGTFEAFDEGRAQQVGADGHITKPFEAQVLVDRVNELLTKSSAAAPTSAPADSAYDFFDQASTELAPEAAQIAPALPPADVLAASGLSADDSFSFGESGAVTGSDLTVALMPETPASDIATPAPAAAPTGNPADSIAIASAGDFGSDALEVDLLDDDSFESQQTSPLGLRPTPETPSPAETQLASDFASESPTSGPDASSDALDFSFGGSAKASPAIDDRGLSDPGLSDPGLSDPGLSDPGLSGPSERPTLIPEPPDAPDLAADMPLPALDSSSPKPAEAEIAAKNLEAEPLLPLEALEEAAGLEAAGDIDGIPLDALASPLIEPTPIEALPELDPLQMTQIGKIGHPAQDQLADELGLGRSETATSSSEAPAKTAAPEFTMPPAASALAGATQAPEAAPREDEAQVLASEPPSPPLAAAALAVAPEWATEAVSPAESQNPLPSMQAAEQAVAPDDADSSPVDGPMRDRVHDAVEKIAWEAFADLSDTVVRQLVERVETIAWEVIPQMTEALIKEEIRRLKGDTDS